MVAGDGSRIATVGAGIGLLLAALVNCGRIELSEAGLWGRTLISGNRVCPIKQFKQIFNELLRYRTQRQKQGDNDGGVQRIAWAVAFVPCRAHQSDPAEPNLVFGSNAHGTVDPSAIYKSSVS